MKIKKDTGLRAGVAALAVLLLLTSAALASPVHADTGTGGNLVILADFVQGAPSPYPGVPPCVQTSRFPQGTSAVIRIRVIDAATGQALTDADLSSLQVTIDGDPPLAARYGNHPGGGGPPTDQFWTAAWRIPADYPTGAVAVTITATANDGRSATWIPFNVAASNLTVIPAVS